MSVGQSVGRLFFTKLIRKLTTGHKAGKNQSTLSIKTFVSQFELDVVPPIRNSFRFCDLANTNNLQRIVDVLQALMKQFDGYVAVRAAILFAVGVPVNIVWRLLRGGGRR